MSNAMSTTTKPRSNKSRTRMSACSLIAAGAAVLLVATQPPSKASALAHAPPLRMTDAERMHVLNAFYAGAPAGANSSATDTVWARRTYAPMHVHAPELSSYRGAIARAFPEHELAFDVVFAAAAGEVPWHADFDSLGPFDAPLASIGREDFITVHANLICPEGSAGGAGRLRTIDSQAVAAIHYAFNRLTSSFGRLGALTEPLAAALGERPRTHDGSAGVGNAFNNLKTHGVSAGVGRVSYVVRLVRKSVRLSRHKVEAAARGGELSTRKIVEFERFLPLFGDKAEVAVGEFPWASVPRED